MDFMDIINRIIWIAGGLALLYTVISHMIRDYKAAQNMKDVTIVYSYFNIKNAAMCVQCETVFNRNHHHCCPACASESAYIVGLALKTNDVCQHLKKGITLQ